MNSASRSISVAILICAIVPRFSLADIRGKVVAIQDGDTLTVLDSQNVQYKVRLSGIDSPEKKQAFGQRAKESLSECSFDKQVLIEGGKLDRYKRLIGKVIVKGQGCNLRQIKLGMAWHYKKYQYDQSVVDRTNYAEQEDIAMKKRIGLWSDQNPIPSWEFRHPIEVSR